MVYTNDNIKKICNFYVNEWHLVTAILPYVVKLVEEQVEIIAYCERSINKNIEVILSRINIKEKTKEKIKKIDFGINEISKIETKKNLVIIVSGSEKYIKATNIQIEKNVKKFTEKIKVKIINCYDISDDKIDINKVIKSYEILLKTSGETQLKINNT